MSSISSSTFRLTDQLISSNLLNSLRRTNRQLNEAQEQIATGKQVNRPSDAPAQISLIQALLRQLEARQQHDRNLQHAGALLNTADQSLTDVSNILIEARNIALDQTGVGSDAQTRQAMADVVNSQLQALIEIANRQISGIGLFSGALPADGLGFVDALGGVRYVGGTADLATDVGLSQGLAMNINGADVFNLNSGNVVGRVNLDPTATAGVRLDDIAGALNQGVRGGSVLVTVDGIPAVVDLTGARTLGDVETRVNDAIAGIDPAAGALALAGAGFELTANLGHTIGIAESGQGKTAADLGIAVSATDAVVAGAAVNPKLTELTALTALGAAVDWTSGLKITQGGVTKTADFSTAQTVGDLINTVDQLNLGLELQISADGLGLDMVNQVSGLSLSIGEDGGTTAETLGLRTLDLATRLADLNGGTGVAAVAGEDDFEVRLRDGSSIRVNLDGAVTVADLITALQNATTGAGLSFGPGNDFNVTLVTDGNGLLFKDGTGGGAVLEVVDLGTSRAAEHLGIAGKADPAGPGDTLIGSDVAQVRVDSAFTFLLDLRAALTNNDARGIAVAMDNLGSAIEQLGQGRAAVALRAQRAEQEQERSAQVRLSEEHLLSDLEDADVTEVITRFTQLQAQLQATLQTGGYNLQLSLLDFLR